jgi:hypothetical protein
MDELTMTVPELTKLCEQVFDARKILDKGKEDLKELQQAYDSLTFKMMDALEAHGLKKFAHDRGTISLIDKKSVKLPVGDDKFALFDFLKERGEFDGLIGIHSGKLNTWFNEAAKDAEEKGEMFTPPGLQLPTEYKQVRLTKSK